MKPVEPIDDTESLAARKDRSASCDMLRATEKAFRDWLAEGDNAAALDLRRIKHRSRRCAYHFAGT